MKVLVVDDHPLIHEALRLVLGRLGEGARLQAAYDCEQGLALAARDGEPDLLLLDLGLPGLSGLPALRAWRLRHPSVPVVVVSADRDRQILHEVLAAGAAGFIPKSTPAELMLAALQLVLQGGRYVPAEVLVGPGAAARTLAAEAAQGTDGASACAKPAMTALPTLTERQRGVLRLLTQGASNKAIGRELDLAERTVKAHVTAVMRALGVSSRTQAAVVATKLGAQGLLRGGAASGSEPPS